MSCKEACDHKQLIVTCFFFLCRQQISDAVANVVGSVIDSIDSPLMESGLDSLGSVELRNLLASQFGVELPATVTLDYPSIAALAGFIASLTAPQARPRARGRARLRLRAAVEDQQVIEIVGASCLYPGKSHMTSHLEAPVQRLQ